MNGIDSWEWYTILDYYKNVSKKSINFLLLEMNDTKYTMIQLTDKLTKNQELFLIGLIMGYKGRAFDIEYVDFYGDKSSYWLEGNL